MKDGKVNRARRVLSIQSSVVHGYVGNRSATFPLQSLGFEVDCLNTVQFSTHTGYPAIHGQRLSAEEISDTFKGLQANGCLDSVAGLLTGYVPGAPGIEAIGRIADTVLAASARPIWVLDPVMGDEERGLYVSDAIPPLYRALMHKADLITPNQFELGVLAEHPVTDLASLKEALRILHSKGVQRIVVTTFRRDVETISIVGSEATHAEAPFAIETAYRDVPFQGTGDLFAALLLAQRLTQQAEGRDDLQAAVVRVLDCMRPILIHTAAAFQEGCQQADITDWRAEKKQGKEGKAATVCRLAELMVVECAAEMRDPPAVHAAKPLR